MIPYWNTVSVYAYSTFIGCYTFARAKTNYFYSKKLYILIAFHHFALYEEARDLFVAEETVWRPGRLVRPSGRRHHCSN